MLLESSFPSNSPAFDFFYELKSLQATQDLTQLRVNSLLNNLLFLTHSDGKVQIDNNQSRIPLWDIILFSSSMYFHLYEIAIYR